MVCRRYSLLFLALIILTQSGLFAQESSYLVSGELLRSIQNEVSGERTWDMVSKISRYHRIRGGGEGSDYNRCVEWLADELKQLGIEDVNIYTYRADGKTKSFLWNSLMGWRVREAELWLVEPKKELIARFSDQAVSLMPYSQGGTVESEVIFVGQGKSDEDYEGLDVKGKLVFARGGGGSTVHRMAVLERGAAGIIVGPSDREGRAKYVDLIELSRLTPNSENVSKTRFGFSLSRRQERKLLSLIREGEKIKMKAVVDAELFDGNMPVLEAVLPGTQFPAQEIVIMGHLDHYKPGANDNASGSAGMMEMVRSVRNLLERGELSPLKRTLRFLWVPEMHGTVPYLAHHQDIGGRAIAGLNLDMIGEDYSLCESTFNFTRSPFSVPGYINDLCINLFSWLEGREFFSPRGSKYLFNPRVRSYSGGSDHVMFNDSYFSVPTPMLGHGDIFHHTNLDTPEKCDPTELKRITSLALAACLYLANADDADACKLAQEVYSQACARLSQRTHRSVHLLQNSALKSEAKSSMPILISNVSAYPKLQAEIEAANVLETRELCENPETIKKIELLAERLSARAQIEEDEIFALCAMNFEHFDRSEIDLLPNDLYKKASSIRPTRLFKGPLPRNILQERLSTEEMKWYEVNRNKSGINSGSKIYEIVNLMDGQRTVLDIRHLVSCEFGETALEFILHYIQDLNKIGLIEF